MQLLAKFTHGSHLYRLDTPTSDQDFKGIYMPELKDLLLGNIKDAVDYSTNKTNEKNSADDVDYEVYSLHKFVKLLSKGEMVCFDMLFAPEDAVTYYDYGGVEMTRENGYTTYDMTLANPVYYLRNALVDMFVHSDMKAYLGYCRRQSAKYGVKGSRLNSLRKVFEVVDNYIYASNTRLADIITKLPTDNYLKVESDHYEVLGKKHQWTTHLREFHHRIKGEIDRYGHRAIQAEKNEGIDWKAISHAFRAGYQIESMLNTGWMQVVLPEDKREYILKVKQGKLDWNDVKVELEQLMDDVEQLAKDNPKGLPDKPDYNKIEDELLKIIRRYYLL